MSTKKRSGGVEDFEHLTDDQLRQGVAGWPREVLERFVLDLAVRQPKVREMLERAIIGSRDEVQARLRLQSAIDEALNIRSVAWKEVSAFIELLDGVLAEVDALGEAHPGEALVVVWYFVEQVPRVFNLVEDEWELRVFCTELLNMVVKLTRAAGADLGEMGRRMIDVYLDDSKETCRFGGAEMILVKAGLDEDARKMARDRLTARMKEFDEYGRAGIKTLRKKLAKPADTGRPSSLVGRGRR